MKMFPLFFLNRSTCNSPSKSKNLNFISAFRSITIHETQFRRLYLPILFMANLLIYIYISAVSGFRLLSLDFLPNIFAAHCIANTLYYSSSTFTIILVAFLYFPCKPRKNYNYSPEQFQVHFDVEQDETTLFSYLSEGS
jgi:hypothetical protein